MKKAKTLTVVLTLSAAIIAILGYMIATNKLVGTSNVSPVIIMQDVSSNNNLVKDLTAKVSSAKLTKATVAKDTDEKNKLTATSRSGFHEAIEAQPEESQSETTIAETNNIEAVETDATEEEQIEEEKPTYQGVELEYSARYNICSSPLSKSKGVTHYNGHKETYYSQRVLAGKGLKKLNNNGRHVADDGTVRDGDGYIAVACNYLSKGSEIMTSLGPGKVYDTGGMKGKWIDIYVNW